MRDTHKLLERGTNVGLIRYPSAFASNQTGEPVINTIQIRIFWTVTARFNFNKIQNPQRDMNVM